MNNETSLETVKAQLMYEWDEEENDEGEVVDVRGKQIMGEQEAMALIARHREVFDRCALMRSYAYYTANQIRAAEEATV